MPGIAPRRRANISRKKISRARPAKTVCTFRDPRDCVASMMTFAGDSFKRAANRIFNARSPLSRSSEKVLHSIDHRVDPETWLHDNHMQNGCGGRWKEELSARQRQTVNAAFAFWLDALDHPPADDEPVEMPVADIATVMTK